MPMDRFMIGFADGNSTLQTDLRPWLIADNAFERLDNAYVFRGRVRKRFGSDLMGVGWSSTLTQPLFSRLRVQVDTTDGGGASSGTAPGSIFKVGQMFSIGENIFTVQVLGTPVDMLVVGSASTARFNTTTGAFVFTGVTALTPVWFYPSDPVMGFVNYEKGPINNQPSYAFDTQFVYLFAGGFWQRSGNAIWHGTNAQFFWTTNWEGITPNVVTMFTTNFNATIGVPGVNDDPIWYTQDGSTWTAATGNNAFYFMPSNIARYTGPYIKTSRLIVAFRNRLVLLNTVENDNPNHNGTAGTNTQYVNRARYSHNGSPLAQNAWYEQNQMDSSGTAGGLSLADGGGFIDATTEEEIISAEFIKDRLIVYFERSTWELAYTGNEIQPFIWQKINTELGSESTFSTVPFDKLVLTIGTTGVHACNGANVERIDDKIPDEIFEINNVNDGVSRVAGIRDYFTEMVYWSIPFISQPSIQVFPSKVLVFNYKNGSWGINDDCITAFGYFEQQIGTTWASSAPLTWDNAGMSWSSGTVQANFRQVIAGNQQGFVFLVAPDLSRNAAAMQISNMSYNSSTQTLTLVVVDHMLAVGEFIKIENAQGVTIGGFGIYKVNSIVDVNTITLRPITVFSGTYTGGGTVARASNVGILSKQWNPYVDKGRNVYLARIDFAVLKTTSGEVTVDYYPSSTELSMIEEGGSLGTNALMGNNQLATSPYLLVPLENAQTRLWHPIYFQTDGECVQIFIYMSDDQMVIPAISESDFEIDALILHTQAASERLQ